ncbi:uncharacterized protein LOC121409157 [Lytechinus variegatus]|uniref:uncharacterized protein LOC121409157 n=1 Tax=Lytechinus variegatus TaxID=7654 RepID=UPI001BB184A9|nr:uncharacterized protein LOC121409157 [Lytechinus variegatus]
MYVFGILLVTLMIGGSKACSCLFEPNLEVRFCSHDYVILAFIIELVEPVSGNIQSLANDNIFTINQDPKTYKVCILQVYRPGDDRVKTGIANITTPSNSAACGVDLQEGKKYILGGSLTDPSDLQIYSCGINFVSSSTQFEAITNNNFQCDEKAPSPVVQTNDDNPVRVTNEDNSIVLNEQ